MEGIHLYPDGSCLDNGLSSARGGWGLPVIIDGEIKERNLGKLREGKQTNNRAEMEAFLQALIWIDSHEDIKETIQIHSDSEIVVKGLNGTARRNANRDIWDQIENMCAKLMGRFTVDYCKGHEDEFNIIADSLAKQAANSLMLAPVVINL